MLVGFNNMKSECCTFSFISHIEEGSHRLYLQRSIYCFLMTLETTSVTMVHLLRSLYQYPRERGKKTMQIVQRTVVLLHNKKPGVYNIDKTSLICEHNK